MAITASMVKELRERTGAGIMDVKNALVEAGGDLDVAAENLRKSGQAKADKKSSRVAADGRVVIKSGGGKAVVVEVNSETDFVANDDNFIQFADAVADAALASTQADATTVLNLKLTGGRTVDEARTELVAKVGENISVRRIANVDVTGPLGIYSHGARIGSLVVLDGGDEDLARDIAMHVAATNPACVDETGVDPETLQSERRIFQEQAEASGKPAEIVGKMVDGRVQKFLKEITLVGQPFVKDDSMTVGQLLKSKGARVISFVRFEVGEGIEKKADNFVEEVMAQVKGAK
ncbi:MAG TPA: translation elongation factor Ts [Woeseiaceae bacterium]|nr:translation elongation factor Ts [Woeseiaceae bacterium]